MGSERAGDSSQVLPVECCPGNFQFSEKVYFMYGRDMNSWKVIWFENNQKFKKIGFPGDSPLASGAIDYAKRLVARGIPVANVHVVSMKKAYGPTQKMLAKQPHGGSWCPYCLKWRDFRVFAVKLSGIVGPEELRCPICTISTNDFFVRKYNTVLIARQSVAPPRLPKAKVVVAKRRR